MQIHNIAMTPLSKITTKLLPENDDRCETKAVGEDWQYPPFGLAILTINRACDDDTYGSRDNEPEEREGKKRCDFTVSKKTTTFCDLVGVLGIKSTTSGDGESKPESRTQPTSGTGVWLMAFDSDEGCGGGGKWAEEASSLGRWIGEFDVADPNRDAGRVEIQIQIACDRGKGWSRSSLDIWDEILS
ncbi:hypothetical protein TIFTF001_025378 [Ficus carica]|uniref:Uncharacterized protein n=1 Tax=Ficus carica TaxID=3494 RepID=A0AA88DFH7_FICCA|nr:hypothetical protein TIFTF001_025378 [Ficus carica]